MAEDGAAMDAVGAVVGAVVVVVIGAADGGRGCGGRNPPAAGVRSRAKVRSTQIEFR